MVASMANCQKFDLSSQFPGFEVEAAHHRMVLHAAKVEGVICCHGQNLLGMLCCCQSMQQN